MKKLIFLSLIFLVCLACNDERESVPVVYQVSNAYSPVEVKYRDSNGAIIGQILELESAEDLWQYSFEEKRGEIVYISARYSDSTSSVKIMIMVGGKVYKQGSSDNEPDKYVTVSGNIPY